MSNTAHPGATDHRVATAKTRVDPAHGTSASSGPQDSIPPLDLLEAIAGRDAQAVPQQMRGQALELAVMLREKQRLLEQRESELNARAALLESDLRAARLKSLREVPQATVTDHPAAARPAPPPPAAVIRPERAAAAPPPNSPSAPSLDPSTPEEEGLREPIEAADATRQAAPPEIAEAELQAQYDHLEQQRRQLREREERLTRRQRQVEQMHDEVTQLHREALELRLASEQVWADLSEEFPSEQLTQSITRVRAQLADHYRLANDALARRKDELHELRNELNLQDQRLRQQRREIQMWADRRYDEIESRMAKIILRERELDQLEADFQRQSLQWQQQREAYRQEIEQLSWQLHERTDPSACR